MPLSSKSVVLSYRVFDFCHFTDSHSARFLALPLEVLQKIYLLILEFDINDHNNLMCVNRQIHHEAEKSFFQRPLRCRSQDDLFEFVARRPAKLLNNITNLRVTLVGISGTVMKPYLASIVVGASAVTGQHPYVVEINRIGNALAGLPNLTQLSILKSSDPSRTLPSSIVVNGVLEQAAEKFKRIQILRIDLEGCRLDLLGAFPNLRSLYLTGFSETSPLKMADVVSKLMYLEELHILGPPLGSQTRQKHGYQSSIVQSVTHHLFERVTPLKCLSVREVADPRGKGSNFLNTKTMKALYDRHRDSLTALHMSATDTPSQPFLASLSAFLTAARRLEEVSLRWPEMKVSFIDCLPTTVTRLEVRVSSYREAQAVVDRLSAKSHRLPWLRRVTFSVPSEPPHGPVESNQQPLTFGLPVNKRTV
ncbi:hypothetical protein EDD36DRAFT_460244 [Exophiala viscosa]|uniref:F-box domain-containing protein n=1 Tax=Exophiala viscosa TaxID=2486360 RepID=A0AAN6IHU4_9EURO|nr:hypothetical protein EDD36DRAFT_460244 [Exophiala viscosa]